MPRPQAVQPPGLVQRRYCPNCGMSFMVAAGNSNCLVCRQPTKLLVEFIKP